MDILKDYKQEQSNRILKSIKEQTGKLLVSMKSFDLSLNAEPVSVTDLRGQFHKLNGVIKSLDRTMLIAPDLILEREDEPLENCDFDLISMTVFELLSEQIMTKSIAVDFQVKGDGRFKAKTSVFSKLFYYHFIDAVEAINHTEDPKLVIEFQSNNGENILKFKDNRQFPTSCQSIDQKIQFLTENTSVLTPEISRLGRTLNASYKTEVDTEWTTVRLKF